MPAAVSAKSYKLQTYHLKNLEIQGLFNFHIGITWPVDVSKIQTNNKQNCNYIYVGILYIVFIFWGCKYSSKTVGLLK